MYFAAAYTFFTVKKHWLYKALKLADELSKYYHGIVHAIYSLGPEVGSGCPENLTILIVCVFKDLYILQNMCIFETFCHEQPSPSHEGKQSWCLSPVFLLLREWGSLTPPGWDTYPVAG